MIKRLDRRTFLGAAIGAACSPAFAQEHDAQSPVILRPEISGVDPRYAAYANPGPYVVPSTSAAVESGKSSVYIWAPRQVRKARLIVFSHGALADPVTYRALLTHWASHGFVVVAPLHGDAVIERGPTLRKNKAGSLSQWPISDLLEDPAAWTERVAACTACLDDAVLFEAALGIEIDLERPLIAGHGYGAFVAQALLGAGVVDGSGNRISLKDPRFFSGIVMSPQGPGVMGLDEASWEGISAPLLYLVAENDQDFTGQPASEKVRSYRLSQAGYKHMGYLKQGTANTFSGQRAGTNGREKALFEVIRAMTTAFAKAYGDYDTQAFSDMTSGFFGRMSLGAVEEGKR